jgi:antitoxin ParD1/3/4
MNVSLTPELEKFIQDQVSSGMYFSASEVIRESLRLLYEQEVLKNLRHKQLHQEVVQGFTQLERGEYTSYANAQTLATKIKKNGRQRKSKESKPA